MPMYLRGGVGPIRVSHRIGGRRRRSSGGGGGIVGPIIGVLVVIGLVVEGIKKIPHTWWPVILWSAVGGLVLALVLGGIWLWRIERRS